MFTNCYTFLFLLEAAASGAVATREAKEKAELEEKIGRKAAINEQARGDVTFRPSYRPFDNKAEERLTRRTSSLEGGIPIDITPYLLHSDSFTLMNNEILHCKLILDLNRGKGLHEFDISASYKVNNQKYHEDVCAVMFYNDDYGSKLVFKSNLKAYYANKYGVKLNNIKGLNIKIHKHRMNLQACAFSTPNPSSAALVVLYVSDREPCYYMFDKVIKYSL
ncbi:MAG: hypothetical protein FWB77_02800 [Treponema sp.]|nr:hypothetical protein [Treponema sp.]